MIFKSSLDLHKETDRKQLPSFLWQGCCVVQGVPAKDRYGSSLGQML